jgi:hypothetical protein
MAVLDARPVLLLEVVLHIVGLDAARSRSDSHGARRYRSTSDMAS